jgi:hypothetical protein
VLKDEGYIFDVAFTSVLKRAIRTVWTVLDESDVLWITVPPLVAVPDRASMAAMPGWPQALRKLKKWTSAGLAEHGTKDLISQVSGRCYGITAVPSSRRFWTKIKFCHRRSQGQAVSEQWPTLRIFDFGAVLTLFCAATKPISKALDRGKHVSVGLQPYGRVGTSAHALSSRTSEPLSTDSPRHLMWRWSAPIGY